MKQPYFSQRSRLFPHPGARPFVWALLAGLLLMNSFAVLSLSHAVQHESHDSGTHHTGLCAWLCAAGQVIESGTVRLDADSRAIIPFDSRAVETFAASPSSPFWFRGPPHSSVSLI